MEKKKGGRHAATSDKNPQKKKKGRVIALCIAVGLLAIFVTAGGILLHTLNNPAALFAKKPTAPLAASPTPAPTAAPVAASGGPAAPTPEPTPTAEPTPEYSFSQERVNILVLGADMSPERGTGSFRTDAMILVSIDFENNDIDMISLPRDSYVLINGEGSHNKINAAFVFGGGAAKDGYQYAMDTVSWTLGGIPVDYYVGFGMPVVKDVVDAMGGIDYDVDIEFTMNGRKTEKGMQHLDGQQVLDYCRFRGGGRGDIDRIDRQQRVLFAMFDQLKSTGQIKNIPAIFEVVSSQIDTNLDLMKIAALAYWARNLNMEDLDRHTLPGEGLYISKTSYWVIHQEEKKELIKAIFGVDITIPAGENISEIKAMANAIGAKVSQVMTLMAPLQEGIFNGSITDPAILNAVAMGQSALMTERSSELDKAITALQPYAGYAAPPPPSDPYWDPGAPQPTPDPFWDPNAQPTPDPYWDPNLPVVGP